MNDSISRAAAIKALCDNCNNVQAVCAHYPCKQYIAVEKLPSAEPERKTGKWIDGQCSNCGCDTPAYIIDWKWQKDMDANYCPHCGAYMGGDTE